MRVGIYPGSFNPVHVGHLAIANYICEFEEYDEIWFLVTPENPIKGKEDLIEKELRLSFVESAIQGYEKFKTCTIEWEFPKPIYTINTLQRLRVKYPEHKFELIIGSDNWDTFHRWKDFQVILNNFKIVIYPRKGSNNLFTNHPNARVCKMAPKIDISSSFIRKSLRKGKDIRFFMPLGIYQKILDTKAFETKESEGISDPEASAESSNE